MYYLLTESFKSQEEKLVAMIQQAVPVEKIYMLGSTLEQERTESIFLTTAPSCRKVGNYWLLVLVDNHCGHSHNYIQDKIENGCRHFIPVTVIVLHTVQFNSWLTEGHHFACTVQQRAVLLHDNNNIPLVIPGTINKKATATYYTQGINKVNEFIVGAALYQVRLQYTMAAFMLHQATEHALHTIFKNATGLHINTHNIDKLLRYCTMVNYKISSIFPRNKANNEKLFQLLQKAYIDTRYKEDFTIKNEELNAIMEGVKRLQGIMVERDFEEEI